MEGVSRDFAEAVLKKMDKKKKNRSISNSSDYMNKSMLNEDGFANAYDQVVRDFVREGRIEELPKYIKDRIIEQKEQESRTQQELTFLEKPEEIKIEFSKIEDAISNLKEFSNELSDKIRELSVRLNIYELKFKVGYLVGYLEDFLTICDTPYPRNLSVKQELDSEVQKLKSPYFDIHINNNFFYHKIG